MAVKSTFIGNTAWVGELEVTNRKDSSGNPYQSKSILFRVATRREYTVTREVNGEQVKERPTDFISCKATGHVAQLIKDYASSRKADGGLQSRIVELSGHFETYKTKKEEKKVIERVEKRQVNIDGTIYQLDLPISVESVHEFEYWQTMFMVDSINFWDSNGSESTPAVATPAKTLDTTAVITATPLTAVPVSDATPATPAVAVTPVEEVKSVVADSVPVIKEEVVKEETIATPKVTNETEIKTVSIPSDIIDSSPF